MTKDLRNLEGKLRHEFFELVALTPLGIPATETAIEAASSGFTGIIDMGCILEPGQAMRLLRSLPAKSRSLGVKLDGEDAALVEAVAGACAGRISTVILSYSVQNKSILKKHSKMFASKGVRTVLEVVSLEEALEGEKAGFDVLLAKGSESGGRVGSETAFVLLQILAPRVKIPVWVQGGVGLSTVAACYAGGASGVVLDSQLYLTTSSPLPGEVKKIIERMDGGEPRLAGAVCNAPYRVYARPGSPAAAALAEWESALANDVSAKTVTQWRAWVRSNTGWDSEKIWPVGQDVQLATIFSGYRTVTGVLRALRASLDYHIRSAVSARPLAAGSSLAVSTGIKYPVFQGPMARVSDTTSFAEAVSAGGALPFIALSTLKKDEVAGILDSASTLLQGRPWGVGLLGFNPEELLDGQLEAIEPFSPGFAVLAGGRPAQVSLLEGRGIKTYVHIPSTSLLEMFIENGARRFIFEGSECGGHIGPKSSFVLWEGVARKLEETLKDGKYNPAEFEVLFAGGVHDARSAAMVAALAGPLAESGVGVGVLMGTAYLFTSEITSTGAITETFQKEALVCEKTDVIEISPGHSIRCTETPFVRLFNDTKRTLTAAKAPVDEIKTRLEELVLGRSRIASKGVERNTDARSGKSRLVTVDKKRQRAEGLFMVGQVAALRDHTFTIKELHEDVSAGATALLEAVRLPDDKSGNDIAVIGISCMLPGATGPASYWERILDKAIAIKEVPPARWQWKTYFDSDPEARDKVYAKWGGFLDDVVFDPVTYGMPPNSLRSIEPLHLLALEGVRYALRDAGYEKRGFKRDTTSVIIGTGGGIGELGQNYVLRSGLPTFVEDPEEIFKHLPEWTEDSFPGILMNVLAGRIANRFNLGGVNYTVDAACASSLAALYDASRELQCGTSDMVIVGGADAGQNPFAYLCFSKTHALSKTGTCKVFDEEADGTVISEGLCFLVLKRLRDAERDGDRIYAVLKSVAGASDGRQKGMTAPNPMGQVSALKRAYRKAGFSPSTVELLEAHGTGTMVGDQVEAESVNLLLKEHNAPYRNCAIGSVKSMIGHTKGAAGLAGIIKAALALRYKVLPPTAGVEKLNSRADFRTGAIYVNTEAKPWIGDASHPRRAGVNAFGFGGTNFHAVLEEYGTAEEPSARKNRGSEIFLWAGDSKAALADSLKAVGQRLSGGSGVNLADLAYTVYAHYEETRDAVWSLAIVATSIEDLIGKIGFARESLGTAVESLNDPRGIFFAQKGIAASGKVAFLFPGQGSQYPDMVKELAMYFHEVRHAFENADTSLKGSFERKLSSYVFPAPSFSPEEEKAARQELASTNIAQPALGAASAGVFDLLKSFGLSPDVSAGHSYGEYTALYSAGVIDEDTLYRVSEARGRSIIEAAGGEDLGTMAAVKAGSSEVESVIKGIDGVVMANMNSPAQTVISGTKEAIAKAIEAFEAKEIQAQAIPVSAAFHSPLVAPAKERFSAFLSTVNFSAPSFDVFSNNSAAPHKGSPEAIREALVEHIVRPVRFVDEIEAMYKAGARVFVEAGPGSVLTNLTRQILEGRDFIAVSTDAKGSGLQQFLKTLGLLVVNGAGLELGRLYEGREVRLVDLANPAVEEALPATAWLVNGSGARPAGSPAQMDIEKVNIGQDRQAQMPALSPFTETGARSATAVQGGAGSMKNANNVMLQFQQMMARFLETQRNVMTAYLGGAPAGTQSYHVPKTGQAAFEAPARPSPVKTEPKADVPVKRAATSAEARTHTKASVLERLLRIAAEKTGYPVDMLNPDVDMEAELGIDSIKRVEILNAFTKTFSGTEMENVRSIVDELSRLKTLNSVVERCFNGLASGPITSAESPAASASVTKENISGNLLRIAGEKTGYPVDMLNPDVDMEAELGIDSIKRVEILNAFTKTFSGTEMEMVRSIVDDLSRLKTLNSVVERCFEALSKGGEVNGAAEAPATMVKGADTHVPRFVSASAPLPVEPGELKFPSDGVVLITDDGRGVAKGLADEIARRGGKAVILRMGERAKDGDTYTLDLADHASVKEAVGEIRAERGRVAGLVHLLPLGTFAPFQKLSLGGWKERLRGEVKGLFALAKEVSEDLCSSGKKGCGWLLAATQTEYINGAGSPDGCSTGQDGISGLLKSAAQEWTEIACRAVTLEKGIPVKLAINHILNEMAIKDGPVEVGYQGDARVWHTAREAALESSVDGLRIGKDWVVLVTGGARGITAEIAVEMARRYSPTLVLVGRSPLPGDEPSYTEGLTAPGEIKAAITKIFRDKKASFAISDIEREYSRITAAREIKGNLKKIEDAGSTVHYYTADVKDEKGFGSVIDTVYKRFKRIDGVIHGAGIIEDKLLCDKTPESFDRVFDTKADSAFILSRKLKPQGLKFIVFFTSVAGFFGNRGQADYAAANEVVNGVASYLDSVWPGRVVAINWGPWDRAGMVTPEVRRQFEQKGIQLVPPDVGTSMCIDEITSGRKGDVEVVVGGGPWRTLR